MASTKATDPITAGLDLGTELIKLVSNILKFFPDYTQKKIEDYHYHHKRYLEEIVKDYHIRDDNRIDFHRDQMLMIIQDFSQYIDVKSKKEN
jgi:hypothetical protein